MMFFLQILKGEIMDFFSQLLDWPNSPPPIGKTEMLPNKTKSGKEAELCHLL